MADIYVDFLGLLPPELKTVVLGFLLPGVLGRCGQVCREWQEVVGDSPVWRGICRRAGYQVAQPHQPSCGRYYRNLYIYLKRRLKMLDQSLETVKLGSTEGPIVGVAYSQGYIALGELDHYVISGVPSPMSIYLSYIYKDISYLYYY